MQNGGRVSGDKITYSDWSMLALAHDQIFAIRQLYYIAESVIFSRINEWGRSVLRHG